MNTIRSTWLGWGSLVVAGGTAYYFAKKFINADRAERHEADMKRKRRQESLEYTASDPSPSRGGSHRPSDFAGSPSQEANQEPAPTRHAPENEGQRVKEKSKYEASEPYRSRKGDRLI